MPFRRILVYFKKYFVLVWPILSFDVTHLIYFQFDSLLCLASWNNIRSRIALFN